MLAVAYLEAHARLGRPKLRENAARLLDRLLQESFTASGGMLHAEGVARQLGDQVWALLAAVRAFQAGLGERWLTTAEQLAGHLQAAYADAELGGYFDHASGEGLGRLGDHLKPIGENSVAALALFELGTLIGGDHLRRGRRGVGLVAPLPARRGPLGAGRGRASDPPPGRTRQGTTGH